MVYAFCGAHVSPCTMDYTKQCIRISQVCIQPRTLVSTKSYLVCDTAEDLRTLSGWGYGAKQLCLAGEPSGQPTPTIGKPADNT